MEEFYESEVMWPESGHQRRRPTEAAGAEASSTGSARGASSAKSAAAPVDIHRAGRRVREFGSGGEEDDEREEEEEEMVPPHMLLSRRRAAQSWCSGDGRTLKGRGLKHVRNTVLRMTGFLEG